MFPIIAVFGFLFFMSAAVRLALWAGRHAVTPGWTRWLTMLAPGLWLASSVMTWVWLQAETLRAFELDAQRRNDVLIDAVANSLQVMFGGAVAGVVMLLGCFGFFVRQKSRVQSARVEAEATRK